MEWGRGPPLHENLPTLQARALAVCVRRLVHFCFWEWVVLKNTEIVLGGSLGNRPAESEGHT